MVWTDDIKQAAYISPSGTRIEFDFEDVARSTKKKAAVFEYPQKAGAFIQDLQNGARRFPIRAFIHGENYNQEANVLYNALEEPGFGTLEHPLYGTFVVFPLSINRSDRLKTAAGQAVFDIDFIENNLDPTPLSTQDEKSAVVETANEFGVQGPNELAIEFEDASPTQMQRFTQSLQQVNRFVVQFVRPVLVGAGIDTSTFDTVSQGITLSDNIASGDVRAVSSQLNSLIRSGSSATSGGPAAYIDLANALVNTQLQTNEQFEVVSFAAESTIGAMAVSTGNTDHATRGDAIADSDALVATYNAVVTWQDDNG